MLLPMPEQLWRVASVVSAVAASKGREARALTWEEVGFCDAERRELNKTQGTFSTRRGGSAPASTFSHRQQSSQQTVRKIQIMLCCPHLTGLTESLASNLAPRGVKKAAKGTCSSSFRADVAQTSANTVWAYIGISSSISS